MIKSDRFLLGIVVGVAALVVVAFILARRAPVPTYRTDDAPDAVAHNYLLALQEGDYAKAYGYLSPSLRGFPATVETFVDDISERVGPLSSAQGAAAYRFDAPVITGNRAVVTVHAERFAEGGLFGSDTMVETFTIRLGLEGATWRLVGIDGYSYWHECWDQPDQEWCARRHTDLAAPKQAYP